MKASALLPLFLLPALPVTADVLISNTSETFSTTYSDIGMTSAGQSSNYMLAQAFATGDVVWSVDSIDLMLGDRSGTLDMSLYIYSSDVDGKVGSSLFTLESSGADVSEDSYQLHAFTATGPISLDANTKYFICLTNGDPAEINYVRWAYTTSSTFSGVSGASIPGTDTIALSHFSHPETFSEYYNGEPQIFSINGVTVPEPSTYAALAGLCVLGLAVLRRRI